MIVTSMISLIDWKIETRRVVVMIVAALRGFTFAVVSIPAMAGQANIGDSAAANASPLELNVRIVWGGSNDCSYIGSIEIDQGTIACQQQLGIDVMDTGFLIANSPSHIAFEDNQTRFGGCDLHVIAPNQARLTVTLQVTGNESREQAPKRFTWLLSDLVNHSHVQNLEVNDAKLSVDRVPGDHLRVKTSKKHFIYDSNEPLELHLQPYALPWTSTSGTLEYSMIRLENQREVLRQSLPIVLDEQGNANILKLISNAPEEEGVYELQCKFVPRRFLPNLSFRSSSIERNIQFVVCNQYNNHSAPTTENDHRPGTVVSENAWQSPLDFEYGQTEVLSLSDESFFRADSNSRFPILRDAARSLSFGRIGNSDQRLDKKSLSSIQLDVGKFARATISKLAPNRLHRLAIEFDTPNPLLQASLFEETNNGNHKSVRMPIASGRYEETSRRRLGDLLGTTPELANNSIELLCWPSSDKVSLEIANLSSIEPLHVRSVCVQIPSNAGIADSMIRWNRSIPTAVMELPSASLRGVFSKPNANTYDDWQLALTFAERVAEIAQLQGFDCVAMLVDGQGSTLFPSTRLSANCRLDTGTFSSNGRDPMRKDIVELMYRCLAKRGIRFVPMLELSGRIKELETKDSQADADLYVGHSSTSNLVGESRSYNPLSQRVQRALSSCVEEFQARYQTQPFYRGFALYFSDQSPFRSMPNLVDVNPLILDRFYRETGNPHFTGIVERDQWIASQKQSLFEQWTHHTILSSINTWRVRPEWVSTDRFSVFDPQLIRQVNPIEAIHGTSGLDHVKSQLIAGWCMQSPTPIAIAYRHLGPRFDSGLARLIELSRPFIENGCSTIQHRNAAQSISRTRIWRNPISETSALIANSNSVAETVEIELEAKPMSVRYSASDNGPNRSPGMHSIKTVPQKNTIRLTIPAGEIIEVAWDQSIPRLGTLPANNSALEWTSDDALTIKQLEEGLRVLEAAMNHGSTPRTHFDSIANSGFESQTSSIRRGGLEGWSTSLDPNALVSIDTTQAAEGSACIQFNVTKSTAIAWLQSDPFPITAIDNVSVNCLIASSRLPASLVLSLWHYDAALDRFEKIGSRELVNLLQPTKSSAKWQSIRVDLSELSPLAIKAFHSYRPYSHLCRLQFEVQGQGTVWLDSVSVEGDSLSEDLRRGLRSELFLAKTSFQKSDFGPSIQLLERAPGQVFRMDTLSGRTEKSTGPQALVSDQATSVESTSDDASVDRSDPKTIKRWRNIWWSNRNK